MVRIRNFIAWGPIVPEGSRLHPVAESSLTIGKFASGFCSRVALFEFQHHNLRIRPESQRRSPRARAARSENLHLADATEAVHKLPVDAPCHPTPRNELPEMRVTR